MHSVELLEEGIAVLKRLGYRVRLEPLDGVAGGLCEFGGRRYLYLDIAQKPLEQLHEVLEVLKENDRTDGIALSQPLAQLIARRRAA